MKIEYDLDILKPHQPSIDDVARTLERLKGVRFVSIKVDEIDQKTTSIFVTRLGRNRVSKNTK